MIGSSLGMWAGRRSIVSAALVGLQWGRGKSEGLQPISKQWVNTHLSEGAQGRKRCWIPESVGA